MPKKIRWGILGTGSITHKFAEGLQVLPDASLAAVGSRNMATADKFADEFDIPVRHGSYESLAEDPDIDVVYVGTPHPMHLPNSVLCLTHGKAVLCEKPFTVNRKQTEELIAVARREKRFLMEAMWTRFLPVITQTRQWIQEGLIGEPRMVQADFGFRAWINEEHRLFSPEFAGGGLLDVGVYCVSLASMVFGGPPTEVKALAALGETGVDEQIAAVLGYPGGRLALVSSAIRTNSPHEARILGEDGMILLHPPFWRGDRATLCVDGKDPLEAHCPFEGNGYNCEAAAVMDCLRAGQLEHPVMPLDESLTIMDTMDRIRAEWGLKYPME